MRSNPNFHMRSNPNFHLRSNPNFHLRSNPNFHLRSNPNFHLRARTLRNIKFAYYNILLIMSAEKDSAQPATAAISVPPPGVLDTMVRVIMGQTEMTHEEVVSALERTNYDLKRVIRDYMTASTSTSTSTSATDTPSSTNQLRFSEIRSFMDKSDLMYYRRKEMNRIYNEVLERKKAEAAARAATAAVAVAETTETTETTETAVSKL